MAAISTTEDAAVAVARQWLEAQGWAQQEGRTYHVASSDVQSCPPGFCCVDVTCTAFTPEDGADERPDWNGSAELMRRSRMLEVDLAQGAVDAVLAARDQKELKQILELERVQQQSAQMEQALEDKIRLRAEAAKAEEAEDEEAAAVAEAEAEAAAAREAAQRAAAGEEAGVADGVAAREAEEKRRADEQFEREVQAEIERALADPAAYAAEQEAIEAAAAAQLAAREAGGSEAETAATPAILVGQMAAEPVAAPETASAPPAPAPEAAAVVAAPPRAGKPSNPHSACEANDVSALRQLLDEAQAVAAADGKQPAAAADKCRDGKDRRGWTPLHTAASSGSVDCVEELLSRGAKSGTADKDGQTALHRAVRHPAVVTALMQRAEDAPKALAAVDKRGCSVLHLAAVAGAEQSCTLFCEAAVTSDNAKAQALLGKPDKRGQTPLMAACNAGHLAVVQSMLAVGGAAAAKVEHVDGTSRNTHRFCEPIHCLADEARPLTKTGSGQKTSGKLPNKITKGKACLARRQRCERVASGSTSR